jgi:hypothetical protein
MRLPLHSRTGRHPTIQGDGQAGPAIAGSPVLTVVLGSGGGSGRPPSLLSRVARKINILPQLTLHHPFLDRAEGLLRQSRH